MMTNEENKEYDMHGKELKHYFKKTVGRLLMEERMAKNLHLEEVSQKTPVSNGGHFSYSLNLFLKRTARENARYQASIRPAQTAR